MTIVNWEKEKTRHDKEILEGVKGMLEPRALAPNTNGIFAFVIAYGNEKSKKRKFSQISFLLDKKISLCSIYYNSF
jgi:hypothetical protein